MTAPDPTSTAQTTPDQPKTAQTNATQTNPDRAKSADAVDDASITVQAYAKINLHLQILGARADGYHDVVTVLQSLALHDTLICESRPGPFELRCDYPGVPLDHTNLIWKAASLIAAEADRAEFANGPVNAVVTLEKRIPTQAGLGGGSADAAAALVAFARLWDVEIDEKGLDRLARRLGADVPFCLRGGTMLGTGRGDELRALPDLPSYTVMVVKPPFGVSTPDAYRWHDERVGERVFPDALAGRWPGAPAGWQELMPSLFNDFQQVVGQRFPEVPATVDTLVKSGARFAAMTGSGAAMIALFDRPEVAEAAAESFAGFGWVDDPDAGPEVATGVGAGAGWTRVLTATMPGAPAGLDFEPEPALEPDDS
jgi:4-diphosphocytidyl-2-C-methyl-D-erythritol kinase